MLRNKEYNELVNTFTEVLSPEEARFFSNPARLRTVLRLIKKWTNNDIKVINIACGPFVLDFHLETMGFKDIIAIDSDTRLKRIYLELSLKNVLEHTSFENRAITKGAFPNGVHDVGLVVLNDALFFASVDLWGLLPEINRIIMKGGVFIFDVWSLEFYKTFRLIYDRVYPQYQDYRKYAVKEVTAKLKESGFELREIVPYFGHTTRRRFSQELIWYTIHQVNTIYFVAEKT